jgi:hypothetical protein
MLVSLVLVSMFLILALGVYYMNMALSERELREIEARAADDDIEMQPTNDTSEPLLSEDEEGNVLDNWRKSTDSARDSDSSTWTKSSDSDTPEIYRNGSACAKTRHVAAGKGHITFQDEMSEGRESSNHCTSKTFNVERRKSSVRSRGRIDTMDHGAGPGFEHRKSELLFGRKSLADEGQCVPPVELQEKEKEGGVSNIPSASAL